ncbi:MAG: CTP synthase [Patescibacteria group bacterium]
MHQEKSQTKDTTKYVFVTGGVISGLGKGISTASIAQIIKSYGYKVSVLKVDMYLNLDAGTINPLEHGEVFVTDDGIETDQDLGNYERFLNQDMHRHNYMTMGQVYYDVITRERQLAYEGEDVEGHVHIPKEIIRRIKDTAQKDEADVMFIEVGGTVGEYQNVMFFEAIRRLKQSHPHTYIMHLVYLIKPEFLGEVKSKPAQSSIYELYKLGLQPDFVICRSKDPIDAKKRSLMSYNAGIPDEHIISAPDVPTIYEIPLIFREQDLGNRLLDKMGLKANKSDSSEWFNFVTKTKSVTKTVDIAVVGKYFKIGDSSILEDAYVCVIEAIKHASWQLGAKPNIQWFDVARFEDETESTKIKKELAEYAGIIVPQGWGSRGVEGKIKTVNYARENKVPYLGLCFGMQMSVIEYSRNVLGLADANSIEVDPTTSAPVIHIMEEQKEFMENKQYGGTIRLGGWPCKLVEGTQLHKLYKKYGADSIVDGVVSERHRHRYEFNNDYRKQLEKAGLVVSGTSPDGNLVEAIELPKSIHPFFVGTQYHPEYKSRPIQPHPLFLGFIEACLK